MAEVAFQNDVMGADVARTQASHLSGFRVDNGNKDFVDGFHCYTVEI